MFRDRIKEFRRVKASELAPSPNNWRTHPQYQQDALRAILDDVGYADAILARETDKGLEVIDGHLRTSLDSDQTLPVLILDVNEEEAKKILLTLDPLAAMAETDSDILTALLSDVSFTDESLNTMLDKVQISSNSYLDEMGHGGGWNPIDDTTTGKLHDTVGYDLISVWPKIGDEETRAYPFFTKLPKQPNKSQDGFLTNYSRSPALEMERIVQTYMRPGDTFLEVCAGWFTFSLTAAVWGYQGEGCDIWDVSLDFGQRQYDRIKQSIEGEYKVKRGDAMALPYEANSFDFIYCNPPFFQLEKYSNNPNDLANRRTVDEWLVDCGRMMDEMLRVAKPGSLIVTVMADYREKGLLVPLHSRWIEEGLRHGLELHDLVVQTMRAQQVRLWRRYHKAKRTVKAHEYVVVFRKPGQNEINDFDVPEEDEE